MAQAKHIAAEGLHWVKDELAAGLDRVRSQIETYIEAPANPLPLQRCLVELHQIRGTLRMIQCDGAGLLAEEMRSAIHDLSGDLENAPEKAFEVVLGGTVQLADYLDLLNTGVRDNALIFHPLINELRVARNVGVVGESQLFARYVRQQEPAETAGADLADRSPAAGQTVACRELAASQSALLRVLRDQDTSANLERLDHIFVALESEICNSRGRRLFAAAAALIEALSEHGLALELDIKRLLGRVGQQLNRVAEAGDHALSEVPDDVLYGIVYYVGRSSSAGPRVSALRAEYDLAALLPDADTLETLRGQLRGPNTGLVNKLSEAIREDLGTIKDSIDLVLRAGDKAPVRLEDAVEMTQRVADTLGMLGLEMLRRVVLNQVQAMKTLAEQREDTHAGWMDVALALLRVEQGLDNALFSQMYRREEPDPDAQQRPQRDIDAGTGAIYREALVNIARIKTLIPGFLDSGDRALPSATDGLLREIEASLEVIGRAADVDLIASLRRFVASKPMLEGRQNPALVRRLADAVAGIEYYLEALKIAQYDASVLYQRAQVCLEELVSPIREPEQDADQQAAPDGVAAPRPEDVDPEIRALFLEEAAEVLECLQRDTPVWSSNVEDQKRLLDIRRAFHTLKGSGRMVGATDIAEFSCAVEHMLNGCLEGALTVDTDVIAAVTNAVDAMPNLIECFQADRRPDGPDQLASLIAQAHRVAGRAEGAASAAAAVDADPRQAFFADAESHVKTLREFAQRPVPASVDKDLLRAMHTLRGGAETVRATPMAELVAVLEQYADISRSAGRGVDAQALALFGQAAVALAELIDGGMGPLDDGSLADLQSRIQRCLDELPGEAREASAARALVEVFTDEASDLADDIDKGLTAWAETPVDPRHPRLLSGLCHTLKGSARTAEAKAIGEVVQALEDDVASYVDNQVGPDSGAFARMRAAVGDIYDLLDQFRHDDHDRLAEPVSPSSAAGPEDREQSQPVADRQQSGPEPITAIGTDAVEPLAPQPPRTAGLDGTVADPASPETAVDEMSDPLEPGGMPAEPDESENQAPPELPSIADADLPAAQAPDIDLDAACDTVADPLPSEATGPGDERAASSEDSDAIPDATWSTAVEAPDEELVEIFLGEADELMEAIDAEVVRWREPPHKDAPRVELMRLLHTLKGGARMAQFAGIGDISHALETTVSGAEKADDDERREISAGLPPVIDQLHDLLDRVRAGERAPVPGSRPPLPEDHAPAAPETVSRNLPAPEVAIDRAGSNWSSSANEPEPHPAGAEELPPEEYQSPEPPAEADEPTPAAAAIDGAETTSDDGFASQLFWHPDAEPDSGRGLTDTARVAVTTLDDMLNEAGEISIYRARLTQQNTGLDAQLQEMSQTTRRLREQLRKLDSETENQIVARNDVGVDRHGGEFDPLQMDRYSALQELSRALSESVTDLVSLHASMSDLNAQGESLLVQHGRVNASLQQALMRTLMVPFSRQVQRLQRIVRQTAAAYGHQAEARFAGVDAELDRNVLERMSAPLEHLLRNAIVHGIETPAARRAAGKADTGTINIRLYRDGTQLVIEVGDDGRGLDVEAIRAKARERGLLRPDMTSPDADVIQFIFAPGFSTARELTQVAGRGVGLDVVNNEIKQLGGHMDVDSEAGRGTRFIVRLPLTLAISQALLVQLGTEQYAIPLGSVEGVTRVPRAALEHHLAAEAASFDYAGKSYHLRNLGDLLGAPTPADDDQGPASLPVLLVRAGGRRTAFAVDGLSGSREIVVKPVGPQVASVPGVAGATVMAGGEVVFILDVAALTQMRVRQALHANNTAATTEVADDRPIAMVVDDSITIRRVSERFLSRHGFRVVTAKDGMDALTLLPSVVPDVVLLDIEMPRVDGFEFATYIRNSEAFADIPIVMITSRSGDKHRSRAEAIGVDRFLSKPYQEQDLLAQIHAVLRRESTAGEPS